MSKRGRRRSSRHRKSSSSRKPSLSQCPPAHQSEEAAEKGETDLLGKEFFQPEDEEKHAPPREKKIKCDYPVGNESNQKNIYSTITNDKAKGMKVVTSVSVEDMNNSTPNIIFQQLQEPLETNLSKSGGSVMKINCKGSNVKLELQETNTAGVKTSFVFYNEKGKDGETVFRSSCDKTSNNNVESLPVWNFQSQCAPNFNFSFSFNSPTKEDQATTLSSSTCTSSARCHKHCLDCQNHHTPSSNSNSFDQSQLAHKEPMNSGCFSRSFSSSDQSSNFSPLQQLFEDGKCSSLGNPVLGASSCKTSTNNNDESSPAWSVHNQSNFSFSLSFNGPAKESQATTESSSNCTSSGCHKHCLDHQTLPSSNISFDQTPLAHKETRRRKYFGRSFSICDHSSNFNPPQKVFEDGNCRNLEDLVLGLSSCRIDSYGSGYKRGESYTKSDHSYSLDVGGLDLEQLSDSGYDPMSMRPSVSTNRSSFTKEFIECQKTKSWIRNNSIATVEHKTCPLPNKRRQTFPRLMRTSGSLQEDHLMHFRESFSSDTNSSLYHHAQTDRQGSIAMDVDKFAVIRSYNVNKVKEKSSRIGSRGYPYIDLPMQDDTDRNIAGHTDADERGDVEFDEENCNLSSNYPSEDLNHRALAIQVIPPSCCTSVEQMPQPRYSLVDEPDFNLDSSGDMTDEADPTNSEANFSATINKDTFDVFPESGRSEPVKSMSLACLRSKQQMQGNSKTTLCRSVSDAKELLKPADNCGSDHWAKRRKLFKESKQKSSTGEGSITSDITEVSVSEDAPSLDMMSQDSEVGGFYTETFHSAAWVYKGDSDPTGAIPPTLNSRSRVISIRERTVKINKGLGDYPWGFRIQFSKPILVTEVDTNGAAEEAGLIVGDYVLAVNGTDVTSITHSEAAELARQGPDILTLTIGSDIARGPNTPRPGCRGYLHKRTQSGLIKGWRKRWFVLTHDGCLHYYRHKRDEGRKLSLFSLKLEGAEVGPDLSLGKPFVFKCRPLLENRVYFFCATSNQDMKRWTEALKKAIHPVTQNHVWVDVTQHNSSLPPLAVKNPECLGLLHKMDLIKDMWVQHYCILKDGCLYLYSGIRATHAHGGIYLHGYTVREQPYGSKKFTIELKPPSDEFKSFYLCAENPNDNKRWIAAIKASVKKWLPLHQALHDYNSRPPEATRM